MANERMVPKAIKATPRSTNKAIAAELRNMFSGLDKHDRLNLRFIKAAEDGNMDKVRRLLKAGADIDAMDNDGWSALMHAAYGKNAGLFNFLLGKGADIKLTDAEGRTAIMIAKRFGGADAVELLTAYHIVGKENCKSFISSFKECAGL
ncbi:MAG: ankyrin repeat domain-containing protein [Candidatus Micrarchaeota archaeon]|nr:ankyrin repeat domain-containing protein [Candidatus Micrarchaeota archaeon]